MRLASISSIRKFLSGLWLLWLLAALQMAGAIPARSASAQPGGAITVEGNKVLKDGAPFVIKGFIFQNIGDTTPALERCATTAYCRRGLQARDFMFGRGDFATRTGMSTARSLGANTIRFNVNQAALDPSNPSWSPSYLDEVKYAVKLARTKDFVVIVALFDGRGEPQELLELNPRTPLNNDVSRDAALTLAKTFGHDRGVMLELLNEPWSPLRTDIGWRLWRDGGVPPWGQWTQSNFVGVNTIIADMRAAGAKNVIILQGLYMSMDGFPGGVVDPMDQVAYAVHPFFLDGRDEYMNWDKKFGNFARDHPMIITAWGMVVGEKWCQRWGTDKGRQFLDYLKAREIGIVAFALDIPFTVFRDFRDNPAALTRIGPSCSGIGELIKSYFTAG
jgi:hypothetical protein